MHERNREQNEAPQPLAGGAPLGAQPPVVVEFEESARRVEPVREPASWPLHLLTWLYAAGVAGGLFSLAFLLFFDPPANLPEGAKWVELKPKMFLQAFLAIGASATTWWLLYKRRRAGAIMAALSMAVPQIPTLVAGHPHFSTLAFALAVIGCAVACWRELD